MQPIPIPQIDRRHANPLPALISLIILLDLADPVVAHLLIYLFAKANVDEEVGVLLAGPEVRCGGLRGELVLDGLAEESGSLSASERAGALGFVVE